MLIDGLKNGNVYSSGKAAKDAGQGDNAGDKKDFMDSYRSYVRDRIREGEPKVQTGGSAMTATEWSALMKKVDHNLDQVKMELQEQEEEAKEEKLKESLEETANIQAQSNVSMKIQQD